MNKKVSTRQAGKQSPLYTGRRRAREFALQGLYQWIVGKQDLSAILQQAQQAKGFRTCDQSYYRQLLENIMASEHRLREQLMPFLDRAWSRVSPIEQSILLIGASELTAREPLPAGIILNEAIELAKAYGGSEGYCFVNRILDDFRLSLPMSQAASVALNGERL